MISKIMTKSEIEKKARRNQIIIGVVLVGLMIMSTLGYSLLSGDDEETPGTKLTYKGVNFVNNGEWQAEIDGEVFRFIYSPLQVENIDVPSVSLSQIANKPLYLDSDSPYLDYEIARNLEKYATKIDYACLNEEDCGDENYAIKNCSSNVISIRNMNLSSIKTEENCIFITGDSENIIKTGDAILYKLLIG